MRRIQLATYDPEAIRSRPTAPKESPVDALLDGEDKTNSNIFFIVIVFSYINIVA